LSFFVAGFSYGGLNVVGIGCIFLLTFQQFSISFKCCDGFNSKILGKTLFYWCFWVMLR